MKWLDPKHTVLPVLLSASISGAQATPITYDFTASDFKASYTASPVPEPDLSGSFTLDGLLVTAIDLTIAGHTYAAGDIATDGEYSLGEVTGNAVPVLSVGDDDFWISGLFSLNKFTGFGYTVAGVNDGFFTTTGTLKGRENSVPEPLPLTLLAASIAGVVLSRRNQRG